MNELLTKKQAAKYLAVSLRTLETMMHNGTGPRFIKLGKKLVRFRKADLDAWIEAQPSYSSTIQVA